MIVRIVAALAAVLLAAAGPAADIDAKTQAFFERPEQIEAVRDAVIGQAASLPRACEGLQFRAVEFLAATPPTPRFDASGAMIEGRVRQRFASSGCGTFAPLFNVWTVAAPGQKVRTFTTYPGTSSASVDLQREATPTATVAAGREAGGCGSLDVIDTRDIGFDAGAANAGGPWREIWLVGGCEMYATVLLHFIPGTDGHVAVDAPADGVRRVALH